MTNILKSYHSEKYHGGRLGDLCKSKGILHRHFEVRGLDVVRLFNRKIHYPLQIIYFQHLENPWKNPFSIICSQGNSSQFALQVMRHDAKTLLLYVTIYHPWTLESDMRWDMNMIFTSNTKLNSAWCRPSGEQRVECRFASPTEAPQWRISPWWRGMWGSSTAERRHRWTGRPGPTQALPVGLVPVMTSTVSDDNSNMDFKMSWLLWAPPPPPRPPPLLIGSAPIISSQSAKKSVSLPRCEVEDPHPNLCKG